MVTILFNSNIIYPIEDRKLVSTIHLVTKKCVLMVEAGKDEEMITNILVTWQRMCIDYRKINENTKNDHFPILFEDKTLVNF